MTLIAYVFQKLQTVKDVVRQMSKKSRFRRPFNKRHGKRSQTLLKSKRQHLYQIYWSLWRQINWKKSVFVISKILGLCATTLTTDDNYSFVNSDNFDAISPDAIIYETKIFLWICFWIVLHLLNLE